MEALLLMLALGTGQTAALVDRPAWGGAILWCLTVLAAPLAAGALVGYLLAAVARRLGSSLFVCAIAIAVLALIGAVQPVKEALLVTTRTLLRLQESVNIAELAASPERMGASAAFLVGLPLGLFVHRGLNCRSQAVH